jgi:hypothetical protein
MANEPQFVTIALGTAGGLTEANLSSYLLAPAASTEFVALDAGTLLTGLQHANRKGNLADIRAPAERAQIKEQVEALNDLGIQFLFPEQGDRLAF